MLDIIFREIFGGIFREFSAKIPVLIVIQWKYTPVLKRRRNDYDDEDSYLSQSKRKRLTEKLKQEGSAIRSEKQNNSKS